MSQSPILWGANGVAKCLEKIPTSALTGAGSTLTGTQASMIATTGADGQLFWNTNYKSLWTWTNNRWDTTYVDPRYGFILGPDELLGTDRISQFDWQTSSASPTLGGTNQPGIYQIANSSASTTNYLTQQLNSIVLGSWDIFLEANVSITQLSNGTDNLGVAFGLTSNVTYNAHAQQTNGVYFTYVDGDNTNKWILNTSAASTNTTSNTSTTITAGTFYRLNIWVSALNSNAVFYVNGTSVGTLSTNIPSGTGQPVGFGLTLHKILGAGSVNVKIDYAKLSAFSNGTARVS